MCQVKNASVQTRMPIDSHWNKGHFQESVSRTKTPAGAWRLP